MAHLLAATVWKGLPGCTYGDPFQLFFKEYPQFFGLMVQLMRTGGLIILTWIFVGLVA